MARPSEYGEEVIRKSKEYIDEFDLPQSEREGRMSEEVIPTLVGLCRYIGRARSTVHKWIGEEGKEAFSDICSEIGELQEIKLVTGGLVGGWNPQVTKMILTKHGYSDKVEQDHTSSDGSMGANDLKITVVAPKSE